MTPVKGQSSSCHKGKEIASNPPTACDLGEEAVYSELDHSDEEETQCALDSECPISRRFPVITPRHCWTVCGLLFDIVIQTFLGLHWLPRSSISTSAKALYSLCPFLSNLDRAPLWVGGNGWIGSYPTWVPWGCYSKPVYWRLSFIPLFIQL